MSRVIPKFIGKTDIPETRQTTIQLLTCWAKLIDEYDTIKPLFKELESTLPTQTFFINAQDICMHLATVLDEKKYEKKRTDFIWVGHPKFPLGQLNCKIASLLHQYFDSPSYVIRGRHRVKTQAELEEERKDKPCPEAKVPC